tara:strand:+ start:294 stop:809 length:516 start_codon:yes stop_codon:yes gene_type:complete
MTQNYNSKKPACFLDRDGVINVENEYVYRIEDFIWIEGAKETIKYLNSSGFYVFVVSNQSGISRGYYSKEDVENLHNFINQELIDFNAHIDDFFYSPYHPDFHSKYPHLSHLRKPNTGMLEMALNKWNFDKKRSFMIGDSQSDIECATKFGIRSHLFQENNLFKFLKDINN